MVLLSDAVAKARRLKGGIMINVCTRCLRINPLGIQNCKYCEGELLAMESCEYPQFRIEQLEQNKKEAQKEAQELADLEKRFPDLKLFRDCVTMDAQLDIVLVRP